MSDSFPPRDAELVAYLDGLLTPGMDAPASPAAEVSPARVDLPAGCPEWIEGAFTVLTFHLDRLRFAVPVIRIQGVRALEGELEIPCDRPSWALGRIALEGGAVWVADTAALILPGKGGSRKYEWALLTASGSLALACHGIGTEQTVIPRQMRWRGERSRRPWLLGMLADSSLPLIDVEKLMPA